MLLIVLGALFVNVRPVTAEGPMRETKIVVSNIEYEWWLSRWTSNEILCVILVDHAGLPTAQEIYRACGDAVYEEWENTPPCSKIVRGDENVTTCPGLYLHLVSHVQKDKEILISLPPAEVMLDLQGCKPAPPENFCTSLPSLKFTGVEPLPNEEIIAISGTYDEQPFTCDGGVCLLPMRVTPPEGVVVEFWADSSFGDSSRVYHALVRVLDSGVSFAPGQSGYFVDVISTQWQGAPVASCVKSWQSFPPVGIQSNWLTTPESKEFLVSNGPYYYLAGRLITQHIVDASHCPTGGLLANGYADTCGLEAARSFVELWQNQFDATIVAVAERTGVPAGLLKNLFAQESQFWPGVFRVQFEYGLGQITDKGADTLLLWNDSFYDQFCPLVLAEDACARGYLHLKDNERALLTGALASQANVDCEECPLGVNLIESQATVELFAKTLQASCDQVAQIVFNATEQIPGKVSSYEDLWRFTVANYHAGPGCLSYAIYNAWDETSPRLQWDVVATRFTAPCLGVVPYVEKITR